ncbi:hypothetical protein H257_12744 [Aphanomyces astaci]|uniref:Uncharacterized protein n=1 Tax=Aphanomyces astaci TaxID=112090 RepID=W4G019_APHAT|nr:hypothetical protein H257_12744 [Aphanomyces astaci]ETV72283.1 hypothetical protein H257_12744 [Aphanomyces astaci]|eukprot:XP_009838351.1 hypothetical protein H257_12744 [Aphanomyces astaci]
MEYNTNSLHNPAQTSDDSLNALYEEPGAYAVNDAKPWTASAGTLMKSWTDIASDLKANGRC